MFPGVFERQKIKSKMTCDSEVTVLAMRKELLVYFKLRINYVFPTRNIKHTMENRFSQCLPDPYTLHLEKSSAFTEISSKMLIENRKTGFCPVWKTASLDRQKFCFWNRKIGTIFPIFYFLECMKDSSYYRMSRWPHVQSYIYNQWVTLLKGKLRIYRARCADDMN